MSWAAASVVLQGRLWLIGGAVDYQQSSSVAIYDIDADSWETGPELPLAARDANATTLHGEVCVTSPAGTWAYRDATWVDMPRDNLAVKELAFASVLLG